MVLRSPRLYAALALVAALPMLALSAATEAIGRCWDWLVDTFAPEPLRFRDTDEAADLTASGVALDPGLLQSLRHEAGVPRYAAARHC